MPATSPAPLFPLRRVWELVRLRYRLQWAQIRNNPAAIQWRVLGHNLH